MAQRTLEFGSSESILASTPSEIGSPAEIEREILRLTEKIRLAERQLKFLAAGTSAELISVHGVSSVVAAGLIGHAGDLRNYRNAGAFAAKCGAAPVPC